MSDPGGNHVGGVGKRQGRDFPQLGGVTASKPPDRISVGMLLRVTARCAGDPAGRSNRGSRHTHG